MKPFIVYVYSQYGGFSVIVIVTQTKQSRTIRCCRECLELGNKPIRTRETKARDQWQAREYVWTILRWDSVCLKRFLIGENTLHALFVNYWEIVNSKLKGKVNFGKFMEDYFFSIYCERIFLFLSLDIKYLLYTFTSLSFIKLGYVNT